MTGRTCLSAVAGSPSNSPAASSGSHENQQCHAQNHQLYPHNGGDWQRHPDAAGEDDAGGEASGAFRHEDQQQAGHDPAGDARDTFALVAAAAGGGGWDT